MKTMRDVLRVVLLLCILVPMAVKSSAPHIGFYIFDVHGTLDKSSGSPQNHAVVVLGWSAWNGGWEVLRKCTERGVDYGPFVATALTTQTGKFALRVSVCGSGYPDYDSLAVAVVYPDTILIGPSFDYDIVKPTVIEAVGRQEKDWGCDEDYTYEDGYIYEYPAVTFPIP